MLVYTIYYTLNIIPLHEKYIVFTLKIGNEILYLKYYVTFANIVTFACKAMPYNLSSFHHSEEPIWVFGCSGLPIDGVLCCHFGGVCAPGSCVVPSAMLLLQGDCQTAGSLDVCCACICVHTCVCMCM